MVCDLAYERISRHKSANIKQEQSMVVHYSLTTSHDTYEVGIGTWGALGYDKGPLRDSIIAQPPPLLQVSKEGPKRPPKPQPPPPSCLSTALLATSSSFPGSPVRRTSAACHD